MKPPEDKNNRIKDKAIISFSKDNTAKDIKW